MDPAAFFLPAGENNMQALVWIFRLLVILVLVWFAVKNAQTVTIHALPEQSWQAPLVFVLLVAFVAGVVVGLLAWLPTVVRQRRENAKLRRGAAALASGAAPADAAGIAPPAGVPGPTDVHGV